MPRRSPPPLLLALVALLTLAASCERGPDLATTLRIDGADVRTTDDRPVVRVTGRFTGDTIIAICDQPLDAQAFRTHPEAGTWIPLERADADRLYTRARGMLPPLPPGTTCDVRLQRNGEPLERQSDEASTTITLDPDVPDAPTRLTVTPSDATLRVAFAAPDDNGAAIRNYAHTFDDPLDANAAWTPLSPSDATPPITVTGLRNGVTYDVALRALNDAGAGRASAPITATPFTTPGAPRNVTLVAGDARLTVSFTPPSDNGAPITHYAYRADAPGHTGTWTPLTPADSTPPLTLTGLRNDTTYTVTLRAINRAGSGAPSAPATATPTAPAP
ncbi:MAG: fibronectin type III domain-containing protein, partial [Trueperaceae bacterium]|nr:fibronectin type III domain-containing protein [Trueperaceae bacterium]